MFIKRTDGAGFPSIDEYEFSKKATAVSEDQSNNAVLFDKLFESINEIKEMLSNGKQPVRSKTDDE